MTIAFKPFNFFCVHTSNISLTRKTCQGKNGSSVRGFTLEIITRLNTHNCVQQHVPIPLTSKIWIVARLRRALPKMVEILECLLLRLTVDQYYYVYFRMFEKPAMFKPVLYFSKFVSIRQPSVLSTDNAIKLQGKNHTSKQCRFIYINGAYVCSKSS